MCAATSQPASAQDYAFVRIKGLAEQAVGEALLREVYKRAGFSIRVDAYPGRRALLLAVQGDRDGETLRVFGLGEKQPTLLRVPTPLSRLRTVGFFKTSARLAIAGRDDLAAYALARVRGVLHTEEMAEGMPTVRVTSDTRSMFRLVEVGRADVALGARLDGLNSLKRLGLSDVFEATPVLREVELYHYLHEKHAALVPKIDAVIRDMVASGDLDALREAREAALIAEGG